MSKWAYDEFEEGSLAQFIDDYRTGWQYLVINTGDDFTFSFIDGGELLGIDVYDIYGEKVFEGLDLEGFYEAVKSGSLPYANYPSADGELYPCFTVFYVKITGCYFEYTGESEYAIKANIIPFMP